MSKLSHYPCYKNEKTIIEIILSFQFYNFRLYTEYKYIHTIPSFFFFF